MTAPLSPQREAEIRAFEEDEHRNVLTMGRDLDDLLAELDRLRAELAALPAPVVETAFRDALGNLWPVGHLRAADEEHILKTTPTIQRTVRYGEWTEVTS
ncbi:hypothetical protein [Streptomyces sp. NBC_00987]|uniref:hypothetical protein n=1 Tax=Streptomyces sp. NBC_00987 TaxID=2903703 RepID=UPI00386F0639|nr:hypothetical protein OG355_33295 [Streptomyces sp. NBC_00987]